MGAGLFSFFRGFRFQPRHGQQRQHGRTRTRADFHGPSNEFVRGCQPQSVFVCADGFFSLLVYRIKLAIYISYYYLKKSINNKLITNDGVYLLYLLLDAKYPFQNKQCFH